jgi:membrane protein YqaA with SNARE-associated domain
MLLLQRNIIDIIVWRLRIHWVWDLILRWLAGCTLSSKLLFDQLAARNERRALFLSSCPFILEELFSAAAGWFGMELELCGAFSCRVWVLDGASSFSLS